MNGRFDDPPVLEEAAPQRQAGLQAPRPVLVGVRTPGRTGQRKLGLIYIWLGRTKTVGE